MEFPFDTVESMFEFRANEVVGKIAPRPLLLLHSSNDSVTPTEQSVRLFEHARQPTDLHLFAETDHFMFSDENPRVVVGDPRLARQIFPGARVIAMAETPVVAAAELERFAAAIFRATGMSEDHAAQVAHVLVWSNLRGNDGHGVQRIPRYIEIIDEGGLNPKPSMSLRLDAPAARRDRRRPRRGSHLHDLRRRPGDGEGESVRHRPRAGAPHDAHGGDRLLHAARRRARHGGNRGDRVDPEHALSRQQQSLGLDQPACRSPCRAAARSRIVLDMATSVVSLGRLAQMRRAGTKLDARLGARRRRRCHDRRGQGRAAAALGGAKGAGLSLMAECIASILTGNAILAPALSEGGAAALHRQNSFLIAIDIARFTDPALFRAGVARLADVLKALPRQAGFDEILLPGERGDRTYAARRARGIPLPPAVWADLARVAGRFGVAMPAQLPA